MEKLADLPNVPPALPMILDGIASSTSPTDARRRLRAMLRDLQDQSQIFEIENVERLKNRNPISFDVHLHGALDLLSNVGCQRLECRFKAADHIAQSFGLMADRVWLTDTLSERLLGIGRATNEKIDRIIADVMVLARLVPLIATGIVRFRSPWVPACKDCIAEFEHRVLDSAKKVVTVFRPDIQLGRTKLGEQFVDTGQCFEPPLFFHFLSQGKRDRKTVATNLITETISSALWVAREAAWTGGLLASNSRVGLAGLLEQEGRLLSRTELLLLDREREFSIPWVNSLNALQIVQLREEAAMALPAFREYVAKALQVSELSDLSRQSPASVIAELRQQASDVRAELKAKQKFSAKYWKVTFGVLGLGLSAYGIANDQILPGVGGILSVLQLLIGHKTSHGADVEKLKSKPAFVMVKAQDILAHASS